MRKVYLIVAILALLAITSAVQASVSLTERIDEEVSQYLNNGCAIELAWVFKHPVELDTVTRAQHTTIADLASKVQADFKTMIEKNIVGAKKNDTEVVLREAIWAVAWAPKPVRIELSETGITKSQLRHTIKHFDEITKRLKAKNEAKLAKKYIVIPRSEGEIKIAYSTISPSKRKELLEEQAVILSAEESLNWLRQQLNGTCDPDGHPRCEPSPDQVR